MILYIMIAYGKQVCMYILQKHPHIINEIYLAKKIDDKLFKKFSSLDIKIITPDSKKAQAMARGGNHQGFLLGIKEYEFSTFRSISNSQFVVVLDGLNDIGNIGSICRTSYALGVDAVAICGIKDIKMSQIIRASSGAALDIAVLDCGCIATILNELKQKKFYVLGANMSGETYSDIDISKSHNIALVVGAEGAGLSKKATKIIDKNIKIDMPNSFDSLNVSVATGILIESIRKRI